jgi:mono/diheme cytochrome c family protein
MRLWAGLLLAVAAPDLAALGADAPQFNRDIRPILADACFQCHGPAARKAGLRLDLPGDATKAAESGEVAIVPGDIEKSELIRRVFSDDETEVMPPPSSKKTLTASQKETIKRWVASGAAYQKHWAFEAPSQPSRPEWKDAGGRALNPIDAFLRDRLQREGLKPAPEADRETLIRRAAFTITGLPPTIAEVDAFLGDTSTRAYENMVERYLNSPRFGEEMARHWLDVARYADTHGMHLDNERQMWPYRDWVVRAFNDNLPFDRFTVEQIAGDLLPNPTDDQLVATGFNRCNVTTGEGGSIDAEWHYRYAVDRASTVAEAFMGLTVGCAVCHDHKLYAFFSSAEGAAMDGNALLHEPTIRLANPEQKAKLADLSRRLTEVQGNIETRTKALAYRDPSESTPADAEASKGPADRPADDPLRSYRAWVKAEGKTAEKKEPPDEVKGLLGRARRDRNGAAAEKKLRTYYLQEVCVETRDGFQPLLAEAAAITRDKAALEAVGELHLPRHGEASRGVHHASRTVRQAGEAGRSGNPGDPPSPPKSQRGGPGQPARPGPLAGRTRPSPDRQGGREPVLAADLRHGPGQDGL